MRLAEEKAFFHDLAIGNGVKRFFLHMLTLSAFLVGGVDAVMDDELFAIHLWTVYLDLMQIMGLEPLLAFRAHGIAAFDTRTSRPQRSPACQPEFFR